MGSKLDVSIFDASWGVSSGSFSMSFFLRNSARFSYSHRAFIGVVQGRECEKVSKSSIMFAAK